MTLILASSSPRRQELLKMLTEDFKIAVADIDETVPEGMLPDAYVSLMARKKAETISQRYPGQLVIGADTIVTFDDKILGKPCDRQAAFEMIQALAGRTHCVMTAVTLTDGDTSAMTLATADVTFFDLTPEEIDTYLDKNEYSDKAGAYGIQSQGALLVKSIVGDYYGIVGFPVAAVARLLTTFATKQKG